jgi:hypothetical protein
VVPLAAGSAVFDGADGGGVEATTADCAEVAAVDPPAFVAVNEHPHRVADVLVASV